MLMDERQVAAALGVSVSTLRKWRWQRRGPKYVKLEARAVRYPDDALAEYLRNCEAHGREGANG